MKNRGERIKKAANYFFLLILLYLFLLSIKLMGSGLKMAALVSVQNLLSTTTNPFVGLFLGILATSIIQSSSATTSIVVGLVGGGVLTLQQAIPMVMGANIGTTITNILVSLSQMRYTEEFKRAFAASVVHDFFNVLTVIVILPLEIYFKYLSRLSLFLTSFLKNVGAAKISSPLNYILIPVIELLKKFLYNLNFSSKTCGVIMLILALILLFFSLTSLVKLLRKFFVEKLEGLIDHYLFSSAVSAFLLGLLITSLIQSSSLTTSLIVPLAGLGLITLKKIYPYTLGANIGTTVTALIASLGAITTGNIIPLTVAFAHLLFNITGVIIFWPLRILPITLAEKFSNFACRKKVFAFIFIFAFFFLIPLVVISLGGANK